MKLTPEELAELDGLETEAKAEVAEDAAAAERIHLEAMRLRKKLANKDRKHGRGFVVVETKLGAFALRAPTDTEIDTLSDTTEDRGAQEKFVRQVAIEPTGDAIQLLFADNPGLAPFLTVEAIGLASVRSEENAKK